MFKRERTAGALPGNPGNSRHSFTVNHSFAISFFPFCLWNKKYFFFCAKFQFYSGNIPVTKKKVTFFCFSGLYPEKYRRR
jgi:hypothetical protein